MIFLLCLAILIGVAVYARQQAIGNGYKITVSVRGNVPHRVYYVYKALGPFPLINWAWTSSYSSSRREDCEHWIEQAVEAERSVEPT